MKSTDEECLLTVCIITFNHAKYIERAINSVLSQETEFSFNIVVADDASNDGTTQTLLEYKKKHPEKIELIIRDKNVGAAENWIELLRRPTSKYIAYLEGDDYWTDSAKLSKQVALMEGNDDISLCFHDASLFDNNTGITSRFPNINQTRFSTRDVILRSWFCPSSSIVFRRTIVTRLPRNIQEYPNGDILLLYQASELGCLIRISEIMSVYNFNSIASMSSKLNGRSGSIKKLENIKKTLININRTSKKHIFHFVLLKLLKIFILKVKITLDIV